MQLTKFTDYSLRILLFLAANGERPYGAREISAFYDISEHHIAKAAKWLTRENYLKTTRGRAGGMMLALRPDRINIGLLVRKTETNLAMVECMGANSLCRIENGCDLAAVLFEARNLFFAKLDEYNLADVIKDRSAMIPSLSLTA